MSEYTPLTEAERRYAPCKGREEALDELSGHAFNVWCKTSEDTQDDEVIDLFRCEFAPWLDRIVNGATHTARTSTATADTDPHALSEAEERELRAERRGYLIGKQEAATADTGLRERVEALAEAWSGDWAGHDAAAPFAFALRRALDATAAPTTDTGARDE